MNGYLVVISCSMDDVPVRLCESEPAAREFAANCDPYEVSSVVFEQRGYISGYPSCVRIQRFADGVSVSDEVVRDLDTEDDDTEGGAS